MKKTSEEREILYKGRYYLFRYLCRQKGIAPKGTKGRWKNLLKEFDNAIARTSPNGWEKGKPITDENVDGLSKYFDIDPNAWYKVRPSFFIVESDKSGNIDISPDMNVHGDIEEKEKYVSTLYENVYFFTHLGKYKFRMLGNYENERKKVEVDLHKIIYDTVPHMLGYTFEGEGNIERAFFEMIQEYVKSKKILGYETEKVSTDNPFLSFLPDKGGNYNLVIDGVAYEILGHFERNDKLQLEYNLYQKNSDLKYELLKIKSLMPFAKEHGSSIDIKLDQFPPVCNVSINLETAQGALLQEIIEASSSKILKLIDEIKELKNEIHEFDSQLNF